MLGAAAAAAGSAGRARAATVTPATDASEAFRALRAQMLHMNLFNCALLPGSSSQPCLSLMRGTTRAAGANWRNRLAGLAAHQFSASGRRNCVWKTWNCLRISEGNPLPHQV